MKHTTWIIIAVIICALGAIGVWAFHPPPVIDVETAPATEGPILRRVVATGTVRAITTVEVGSQVSGTIAAIDADFNSIVKAGQVIARLDPSLFKAARNQAAAGREEAEAALRKAETDVVGLRAAEADARAQFNRARMLADREMLDASDLDAARVTLAEAVADVQSAEARVAQARGAVEDATAGLDQAVLNLDRTTIKAPIDGIVVERDVDVGQTVAASVQTPVLFRIATDLRHIQVQVDVDEADIGGIVEGEPVTFTVGAYPDQTFAGGIQQIRLQPIAEQTATATTIATSTTPAVTSQVPTVVSYTVVVAVENPDERLRPGMTAEVALRGSRRERAVRIPTSALAFRPSPDVLEASGGAGPAVRDAATGAAADTRPRQVWRYDGRRLSPVAVHIGLADDRWTELTSGEIHDGDRLATNASVRRRF